MSHLSPTPAPGRGLAGARRRGGSLPLLARHFLAEFAAATGKTVTLGPDVYAALANYPFPGNVRELRNLVNRVVALAAGDRVTAADLPEYVTGERTVSMEKDPFRRFLRLVPETNDELKSARKDMQAVFDRYVRRLEAKFLRRLLDESDGNVAAAARRAWMNRTLFHRKMKEAEEEEA